MCAYGELCFSNTGITGQDGVPGKSEAATCTSTGRTGVIRLVVRTLTEVRMNLERHELDQE